MKQCESCGSEFLPSKNHSFMRFCSYTCRRKHNIKDQNYKRKAEKRLWAIENKHRTDLAKQKWLQKNTEKRKKASSDYIKRNIEYYMQYRSLYRRKLLQAKPKWADEVKLKEIYRRAKESGLEVDHVYPLQGKTVCGLHVPENLQLLTRSQNARKSNKLPEEVSIV